MEPMFLIFVLVSIGVLLLVAEVFLPTHGMVGAVGGLLIAAAIGVVFSINRWAGLGVLFATIVASPFIAALATKLWSRSPIGRKMILQPVEPNRPTIAARIGQTGTTVSDLRPIGECDFGELRLEAASELGIIPAGRKVRIVDVVNGRPTVRMAEMQQARE